MQRKLILLTITIISLTQCVKGVGAQVFINEVLPNPKGKDQNQEWIELINEGEQAVNLAGWKVQIKDKFSEIKSEKIISPGSLFVIEKEDLSKSLTNQNTTLSLLSPEGKVEDQIFYGKSIEGKSFSRVSVLSKKSKRHIYQWGEKTKGEKNNYFEILEGVVFKSPNKNIFQLQIGDKIKTIHLEKYNPTLLKLVLGEDQKIKILTEKMDGENHLRQLKLLDQALSAESSNKNDKDLPIYYLLVVAILMCPALFVKKL